MTLIKVIPWNRVLDKSTVTDLFKYLPFFVENFSSLPCSQEPSLVPIQSQINLVYNTHPIFLRSILILFSLLRLGLPIIPFISEFPTKVLRAS
jgi:hypothetical protein